MRKKAFAFSATFVRRVQEHFGSDMSPRLQEYLDEGDHVRVAGFLRGSREWPTRDAIIQAILTKPFVEARAIAFREERLHGLELRCLLEVYDHNGINHTEFIPA